MKTVASFEIKMKGVFEAIIIAMAKRLGDI